MIWPLLILLSSLTFAAPRTCLTNSLVALSEYKPFPKKSMVDGSPILNVHTYIEGMAKKPKWQKFAEKIKQVREWYAPKMKDRRLRGKLDPRAKHVGYGYERMKKDAQNLVGKTVEEAFERFNPGKDFYFIADGTKVIISPKNKILGMEYVEVLYDVSGNYFRLQKGKHTGYKTLTFISEQQRYIDWEGALINTGNIRRDQFEPLMHKAHWNALID
jgi:hypothetical protein